VLLLLPLPLLLRCLSSRRPLVLLAALALRAARTFRAGASPYTSARRLLTASTTCPRSTRLLPSTWWSVARCARTPAAIICKVPKIPTQFAENFSGYVRFKTAKYMPAVKTALGDDTAHCEKANGNEEQNRTYCSKGGNFVEFGTYDAGAGTAGRRTDLHATVLRVQAGATMRDLAMDPEHAVNLVKHQAGIQALMNLVRVPPTTRDVHTTVLWGPTGTGKSHRVWHAFPRSDIYMAKLSNPHPWDHYTGQPVLFLDEFSTDQVKVQELNTLLDKWPVMLQSRYADKHAYWTTVVIAANSDPNQWYRGYAHNTMEADSLLRRLTEPMGRIHYVETREQEIDLHWSTVAPPPPALADAAAPPPPSTRSIPPRTPSGSRSPPTPQDPSPRPLKRSRAHAHLQEFFAHPQRALTADTPSSSRSQAAAGAAANAPVTSTTSEVEDEEVMDPALCETPPL